MTNSKHALLPFAGLSGIVLAVTLAACGGGGGGGTTSPVPTPSAATPIPPLGANGVAAIGGAALANASVVFSCGCTGQAGITTTDVNGNYALAPSTTATPAAPTPTYTTAPGRNYLEVITATTGAQAWDIIFLGNTPADNHMLNATNTSDKYTTAAALYVYYNSITSTKADAFDTWNFNTIASWVTAMQTAPIAAETTLLSDITTAQTSNRSLFPSTGAAWKPAGTVANTTIKADLDNLQATAVAQNLTTRLPQQCDTTGVPCAVPTP